VGEHLAIQELPPARLTLVIADTRPTGGVEIEPGQWLVDGETPGIDMSDGYAMFSVTGAGANALLARGLALDLDRLAPDFAGRTKLGEIAVLLDRVPGGWRLRCERSYAEWLGAWLTSSTGGT
jgi:heterotetrameric sarcosine oxidase gamma subunit